jgi:spermidine/putrescine transport system ATP-binding protein
VTDEVTISARNVVKAFGQGSIGASGRWTMCRWTSGGVSSSRCWALGLRQDHASAPDRRVRDADRRHDPLDGSDITTLPPNRRPVNTVFQSYALFPHLTVAQNIAFGLEMLGKPASEVKARTAQMLALVKLETMAGRKTGQLSGGQQQRVALARALAPQPKVLLLDEPLSALDLKLRKEMQIELKRLQLETGITFIFVTHDQEEALTMSDRIAVMSAGKIQQVGTAKDIYIHPRNRFVASFIGETNFLTGTAEEARCACPRASGSRSRDCGRRATTVIVRPEQLRLGAADGAWRRRVKSLVYFGTDTHCHLALADGTEMVARLQNPASGEAGLAEGQTVGVTFAKGAVQRVED